MFKNRKIHNFVKRYCCDEYFSKFNCAYLEDFLKEMESFTSLIPKINKLSNLSKHYVLSTIINYQNYGYDSRVVELILNHKLDLLKEFGSIYECPDLDHIYYALRKNENIYKLYVKEYIMRHEAKDKTNIQKHSKKVSLVDYTSLLTKYYLDIDNLLAEGKEVSTLKNQLFYFKPKHLRLFLDFKADDKAKKQVFKYLTVNLASLKEAFSSFDAQEINEILDFIFARPYDVVDTKLYECSLNDKLIILSKAITKVYKDETTEKYELNSNLINNAKKLPFSFLDRIVNANESIKEKEYQFVESLHYFKKEELVKHLLHRFESFQTEKSEEMFINFVLDEFVKNSDDNRKKILFKLFPEQINKTLIDEQILVEIPEIDIFKESINSDESLEFINPKTNMKVKIRKIKNII